MYFTDNKNEKYIIHELLEKNIFKGYKNGVFIDI